jgi:dUTP pyrophosphatase
LLSNTKMPKEYVLRIKPLTTEIRKLYENQQRTHKGDAGIDLYNSKNISLTNRVGYSQYNIDFMIQCQVVKNYLDEKNNIEKSVDCSYMLVPRSSIVKTPFRMSNSIGIIDAGYRGNIMAFVDKLESSDILREGDRLFQIVLPNLKPIDRIEIVKELSSSSRGDGGFGSTGVN